MNKAIIKGGAAFAAEFSKSSPGEWPKSAKKVTKYFNIFLENYNKFFFGRSGKDKIFDDPKFWSSTKFSKPSNLGGSKGVEIMGLATTTLAGFKGLWQRL